MKAIVIGGGISGLAISALLAKDGHEVTLIEKNKQLGGRSRVYKDKGYTFDMGPSWYMMPEVFEKFFDDFGKDITDYYQLKQLDTHYKVFFPNERSYKISSNLNKNIELFEKTESGAGEALRKYLKKSEETYNIALNELVRLDYQSLLPLLNPKLLAKITKLNLFSSFHNYVTRFFKNPDLQKIIEFTTVFLGGSPYNTPAFYSLITHADFNLGIYYPKGGIHKFIEGLAKLVEEQGVEIKTGETVEKIEVDDSTKLANNVITNKSEYTAEIVVNSADYQFAETQLLKPQYQTYPQSYWDKRVMSPCAFNIYLGLDKKIPKLEHHNLYFDNSWDRHFKEVYDNPDWPDEPSFYVHVPSRTDPTVAPKNCDTVFILVPVASGLDDTEETREKFSKKIIKKLEEITGESINNHIVTKQIFSHRNYKQDYNAFKGAAFGMAHTLFQTAIFRARNKSKKVHNLYHVGQYTNPGVGMPIVLISAEIVSDMIRKDYGKT